MSAAPPSDRLNFQIGLANYFHPDIAAEHLFKQLSVMADLTGFLQAALEECGHLAGIGVSSARKDAINIYFEWFLNSPHYTEMLKSTGCRFGIVCTELLTEDGRYNPYDHDGERARFIYDSFARDARYADFVWCLIEESVPVCRRLNANTHFLPLGFVEPRRALRPRAAEDCYIDFIVSGFMSKRRAVLVQELMRRGYRATGAGLQPEHVRDSLLECSRVSLSPQKTDTHQIFSFGRINHAIVNRIPILVEYDGAATYLSPYCRTAPAASFLDACVDFLERGDPAATAAANREAFRRAMPMRPIMERLLAETQAQFAPLASVMDMKLD